MPLIKNKSNDVLCYIHIPKTAGTTLQSLLSERYALYTLTAGDFPCSPQHFHAEIVRSSGIDTIIDGSFAIVREPLSRLISEYKYRKQRSIIFRKFISFDFFVSLILSIYPKNNYLLDNHIRPQSEFILENTKIYYFEDGVDYIVNDISKEFNIGIECSNVENMNRSKNFNVSYSMQTIRNVNKFYKVDYDLFDYEKPLESGLTSKPLIGLLHGFISQIFTMAYRIKRLKG